MTGQPKRLGELVLRSANPRSLVEFYRDILGLELYATIGSATFLKVADDLEGHPQLLAIFDKSHGFSGPKDNQPDVADSKSGTLHHFAFALAMKDFLSEQDRLQGLNVDIHFSDHPKFGWRSIYMYDPDGNSVELVCYDPSILDKEANRQVRQAAGDMDRE
jgi:catechol-2,3-dioxygenase